MKPQLLLQEKPKAHNYSPETHKKWYAKNRMKVSAAYRERTYGITTEEFEAKLKAQKGMCAICKIKRARVIDHCHAVFKVRGILCHSCNFALGCAKDSPAILRRAVKYLKESCGA